MERTAASEPPAGSPANPIHLPKNKKVLKAYYEGKRLDSPMGGQLDILGVREGHNGTGRVLMECNTSSLRYVLIIPKATKEERKEVKNSLDQGHDPTCPRHGPQRILTRSGKNWVCPLCGVGYAKT